MGRSDVQSLNNAGMDGWFLDAHGATVSFTSLLPIDLIVYFIQPHKHVNGAM